MENKSPSPRPNNLEQNSEHPNDGISPKPNNISPKPNNLQQSPEDIIDLEIRKLRARIKKAFINFKNQTWGAWVLLFSKQNLALSLKNQKKGPGGVSISAFDKLKIFLQAFESIDSNTRKAISKINSESRNLDNKAILNVKKISSLELRKSITKKVFFIKPIDNEWFLFCKIEKPGEEMLRAGKGYVHKTNWRLGQICFYWLFLFFNERVRDPSKNKKKLNFISMVEGINNWLSPKSADLTTMPDFIIAWNDSYPKEIKPKEIKTYEARLCWNLYLSEEIITKSKIPKKKGSKSQKLVRFNLNDKLTSDGVISYGAIEKKLGALTDKLKERDT